MKITDLILSDHNPRQITDDRFKKLVQSIEQFPKMMKLRPIIYDPESMNVLGGNMRLRALIELGYKTLPDDWVKPADELTNVEKERFIITDNIGFGEWDMDILANEFDMDQFKDWGLDEMLPVNFGGGNGSDDDEHDRFTPDWRLMVTCKNEEEFNDLYYELKAKGVVVKVMGKK